MGGSSPDKAGAWPVLPDGAGPASDDGEEYERNQRFTSLNWKPACRIWWMGRVWCAPRQSVFGLVGELLGGYNGDCREAMVKVYGVAVAMPQGQSWVPTSLNEQQ